MMMMMMREREEEKLINYSSLSIYNRLFTSSDHPPLNLISMFIHRAIVTATILTVGMARISTSLF